MKIAHIDTPEHEVDLETVWRGQLHWFKPTNVTTIGDDELLRAHEYVKAAVAEASGPVRMGIGGAMLKPIEAELKRRGIKAAFWTHADRLRSDLDFIAKQQRSAEGRSDDPLRIAELLEHERATRAELEAVEAEHG